jgi:hypothetical protein
MDEAWVGTEMVLCATAERAIVAVADARLRLSALCLIGVYGQ